MADYRILEQQSAERFRRERQERRRLRAEGNGSGSSSSSTFSTSVSREENVVIPPERTVVVGHTRSPAMQRYLAARAARGYNASSTKSPPESRGSSSHRNPTGGDRNSPEENSGSQSSFPRKSESRPDGTYATYPGTMGTYAAGAISARRRRGIAQPVSTRRSPSPPQHRVSRSHQGRASRGSASTSENAARPLRRSAARMSAPNPDTLVSARQRPAHTIGELPELENIDVAGRELSPAPLPTVNPEVTRHLEAYARAVAASDLLRPIENGVVPENECPICQSSKPDCQTLCGHQFCRDCISRWIAEHYNCPNCRASFEHERWKVTLLRVVTGINEQNRARDLARLREFPERGHV